MPVGAVVATDEVFAPLDADPLLHSSTFAGNPLAAAAVSATLAVLRDESLVERSAILGQRVLGFVRAAVAEFCPHLVHDVRGRGLLAGIEFRDAALAMDFLIALLDRRVIPSYSLNSHSVLRLTPPAILDEADLEWLATALKESARELGRQHPNVR
jgi:putrescine aminotransferase